jgi:small-conductance mechanosensitive channel
MEILEETTIFENSIYQWGLALLIFTITLIVLLIIRRYVIRYLVKHAAKTETDIDDLIKDLIHQTKPLLIIIFSAYFGSLALTLPENIRLFIRTSSIMALILQVGFWGMGLIEFGINYFRRQQEQEDPEEVTELKAIRIVVSIFWWSLIILLMMDNIPGVNVTSLIASLGIGGIAVALAVQGILGDLFASLSITLDKPFVIGDTILVDDLAGTVEDIGLKSTRLRSVNGEQLIFSNSDLLESRIHNFKRQQRRRVSFTISVTYQTPHIKLESIPDIVRETFSVYQDVTLNSVHLKTLGESAVTYEVIYHVEIPDYTSHIEVQQGVNLELYRRFEEEGIEFAYPSQTIYLEK